MGRVRSGDGSGENVTFFLEARRKSIILTKTTFFSSLLVVALLLRVIFGQMNVPVVEDL